jgi:hypothetical protein
MAADQLDEAVGMGMEGLGFEALAADLLDGHDLPGLLGQQVLEALLAGVGPSGRVRRVLLVGIGVAQVPFEVTAADHGMAEDEGIAGGLGEAVQIGQRIV